MEETTLAAGCFWGIETAFRKVPGVTATEVGYIGGTLENPSYRDVCSGRSGHAEAVHVTFDPSQVSFTQILEVFWNCHDPTTLDRQGFDVGSQYRSAIFFHGPDQEAAAIASRDRLQDSGTLHSAIVTEIVPAAKFYRAEDDHQQYLEKRGAARHA